MTDDADVGIMAGWCATEADLEFVKKTTHDDLIRTMGARRTSGVRWAINQGAAAVDALGQLRPGASVEFQVRVLTPIEDLLDEHGGFLVVAMADGKRP